jgi:hypothetical protein
MLSHFLRAAKKPILFIGENSGGTGVQTVTLNTPTGAIAGDLLVAFGYCGNSGNLWTVTGSGWTITNAASAIAPRLSAFYAVYDGTTTNFTFSNSLVTSRVGVTLMAFRYASVDVVSTVASAADPVIIPSVTVTNNNSIQLITAGANNSYPASTPSGYTQIHLNNNGTPPEWGVYYKNINAGSTGTVSVDMINATATSGMQVILK